MFLGAAAMMTVMDVVRSLAEGRRVNAGGEGQPTGSPFLVPQFIPVQAGEETEPRATIGF
jgi:hypothetical protein